MVEHQPVHPVLDEAVFISRNACHITKFGFQRRQRAGRPEPRLEHHEADRQQVQPAEHPVTRPRPAQRPAGQDQHLAADNEHDEERVHSQRQVRQPRPDQ